MLFDNKKNKIWDHLQLRSSAETQQHMPNLGMEIARVARSCFEFLSYPKFLLQNFCIEQFEILESSSLHQPSGDKRQDEESGASALLGSFLRSKSLPNSHPFATKQSWARSSVCTYGTGTLRDMRRVKPNHSTLQASSVPACSSVWASDLYSGQSSLSVVFPNFQTAVRQHQSEDKRLVAWGTQACQGSKTTIEMWWNAKWFPHHCGEAHSQRGGS